MVQTSNIPFKVQQYISEGRFAEEIRKEKGYQSLPDPVVEKLYTHGIYLLKQLNYLLKTSEILGFPDNNKMLYCARHSVYLELCDLGFRDFADKMRKL